MKLSDKISMAYRDVTNRKFRSFLTILAISVGALLLVAMLGLGDGISKKFDDLISSFGKANEINIMAIDAEAMNMGVSVSVNGEEVAGTEEEAGTEEKTKEDKTRCYFIFFFKALYLWIVGWYFFRR